MQSHSCEYCSCICFICLSCFLNTYCTTRSWFKGILHIFKLILVIFLNFDRFWFWLSELCNSIRRQTANAKKWMSEVGSNPHAGSKVGAKIESYPGFLSKIFTNSNSCTVYVYTLLCTVQYVFFVHIMIFPFRVRFIQYLINFGLYIHWIGALCSPIDKQTLFLSFRCLNDTRQDLFSLKDFRWLRQGCPQ
jgi:hypothetical protein